MKRELPKAYDPQKYEDGVYRKWEKAKPNGGYFNPDNLNLKKGAKSYSIVLPPPNVTGTLHMGHAAMLAIEDILIRYHRMKGYRTLWVPGTDHAAIATQTKVEKIIKEEGTNRHELGREKFLKRVESFARQSHDTIVNQVKKMGASCDWSREAYTLDETRHKAVYSVFKLMYDDGLIYRGKRIVNWCPRCHSVLADDEVEYRERKGKLYWLKYGPFVLATARPETKLGDTAVAVHPDDKRYKKMIGKKYMIPGVLGEFEITVVADKAVDPEFGSGAIKVTPAHSFVDNEIAERHGIGMKQIINEDGKMMDNCGKYTGMTTKKAREAIVKDMEKMGLIEKIEENYTHNIALCYRCDTQIEPIPSEQWFIDVNKPIVARIQEYKNTRIQEISWKGKSIKEIALEVVKSGKIKIFPERFEKNYYHWMENLRDWCISRQIWYGHQVPVWYRKKLKIKNEKLKIVELNFRDKGIFDLIKSGQKTIETRALNPEEKERYFGNIKRGDEIVLNYCQGKLVAESLKAKVVKSKICKNIDELLGELNINKILPGKTSGDLKKFFNEIPEYEEKINKNGIIALELSKVKSQKSNVDIYVGVEAPEGEDWVQDGDTLDTWFSSGLWTFSTLASSPEQISIKDRKLIINSDDFKNFHPTQVMETGYDILFFWVARMIIMTTYAVQDIPFEDVYLHGLVLDDKGKKMSKSKGNVIDPLDMCQKYGTDATRLSLVVGSTPGNDLKLSEDKIAGFRNFSNKLWNIARYVLHAARSTQHAARQNIDVEGLTLADKFILGKLEELIKEVTNDLNNYRFSQAGERLRIFTWNDLADWYLEATKFQKGKETNKVLIYVLRKILKLWHPFIPFVTEVIWEKFNRTDLIVEKWPEYNEEKINKFMYDVGVFELLQDIIEAVRKARAENKVEPVKKVNAIIVPGMQREVIENNQELIKSMRTGIKDLQIKEKEENIKEAIKVVTGKITIYLIGAVDKEKEKKRKEKEIANKKKMISSIEKKLGNGNFIKKAPKEIVKKEKDRMAGFKKELKELTR